MSGPSRVRLRRRVRTDQLYVWTLFLLVGGGLVVGGTLLLGGVLGTIGGVLLILLGSPFLLLMLLRLLGWRTLLWSEWLVAEPGRIVVTRSPREPELAFDLTEAVAVGLYDGADMPQALLCVHYADRPPRILAVPRGPEIVAAVKRAAPPDWTPDRPAPCWPVRVVRAGTPEDRVPGSGPADAVVVRQAGDFSQALIAVGGIVLVGIFGPGTLLAVSTGHVVCGKNCGNANGSHTDYVLAAILGSLFTLLWLSFVVILPVILLSEGRTKHLTIGPEGLGADGGTTEYAWREVRTVDLGADGSMKVTFASGEHEWFEIRAEPKLVSEMETVLQKYAGPCLTHGKD